MKIIHVITDLVHVGGAEVSLLNLISNMDRDKFPTEVVSMTDFGPISEQLEEIGVHVSRLGMKNGIPSLSGLNKLVDIFREKEPDVVHSWMVHSNLISTLAVKKSGVKIPVVWGIRQSRIDPQIHGWKTIMAIRACGFLSRSPLGPARILCNAEACIPAHEPYGYEKNLMSVIPNGFDTSVFKPDEAAAAEIRTALGISPEIPLVGLVARFNPTKDHEGFVKAAALLNRKVPFTNYVLCGKDIDWDNSDLAGWIRGAGLEKNFHLLGRRLDLPKINAALDLLVSSSVTEAFSRVIGEAMACGVPCVVTNVGDSAAIVADTGIVVPPSDPEALSDAMLKVLSMPEDEKTKIGNSARKRIIETYSIETVIEKHEKIYNELGL